MEVLLLTIRLKSEQKECSILISNTVVTVIIKKLFVWTLSITYIKIIK